MKKYIFIDIDGTLTNSKKEISIANKKAMSEIKKWGYDIVYTSGRCNKYLLDLNKEKSYSRYLISSNGSLIYDSLEKKIIYYVRIPFEILKKVYDYCNNNGLVITFNTEMILYSNIVSDKYQNYEYVKLITDIEDIKDKCITQFVVGSYEYDKMLFIRNYLDMIEELEIVNVSTTMKLKLLNTSEGFFYDVTLKKVNKGKGIRHFLKLMDAKKEDSIAIGDHINDMEMFDEVGYKIAMANGYQELKEKADFITKSNDEDGVKYALEHIQKEFLGKRMIYVIIGKR